jgi:hypothetical protein
MLQSTLIRDTVTLFAAQLCKLAVVLLVALVGSLPAHVCTVLYAWHTDYLLQLAKQRVFDTAHHCYYCYFCYYRYYVKLMRF